MPEAVYTLEDPRDRVRRAGTVAIAEGQSLSDVFPLYLAKIINLGVPTLTSAALSFQVQAYPNGTFYNLYDENGVEVVIPAGTHVKAYSVPELAGWYAFKIRSGVAATPVNQVSAVTIDITALD